MSIVGAAYAASHAELPSSRSLFVLPHERREGFWANIRGHVLELADPDMSYGPAPNPDDLLILSIASELAWTARRILRGLGLPDVVNVSAGWRTTVGPPSVSDINLTVTVSGRAESAREALTAALDKSLAARSLVESVARISLEGANR